jgi:hypothetical protein
MSYLNDTMRVEMALPVHMMLAVLICGANCADPGPMPRNNGDLYYLQSLADWKTKWRAFDTRLASDLEFAKTYRHFRETRRLLLEASAIPLEDLYFEKKRTSLTNRIQRTHLEVVAPYLKGDDPDPRKIGIIAYYLLQHLVDTNVLIVPEDSAFGQALAVMLPALSPWEGSTDQEVEDYERLNRSAQKQVRKVVQQLQIAGYYEGIPLPDYVAS